LNEKKKSRGEKEHLRGIWMDIKYALENMHCFAQTKALEKAARRRMMMMRIFFGPFWCPPHNG